MLTKILDALFDIINNHVDQMGSTFNCYPIDHS